MERAGLPADTTLGPVHLRVADLDRSLGFYVGLLDFHVAGRTGAAGAHLSAVPGGAPLIRLSAHAGARRRPARTPGLYHFAILYPDRRDLGRTLLRLFEQRVPFDGFADHGVSEAAYLSDPDGNGIELAADRPRAQWPRSDHGIALVTEVLNVTNLLRAVDGDPWIGPPAGTRIGHVHLHVTDVAAAARFYADVIGFARTAALPDAVFLAAGGYHHHLAVNAWGTGARPAGESMAGLIEWQVQVPDPAALQALGARLAAAGASIEERSDGFVTADPEGNRVAFV